MRVISTTGDEFLIDLGDGEHAIYDVVRRRAQQIVPAMAVYKLGGGWRPLTPEELELVDAITAAVAEQLGEPEPTRAAPAPNESDHGRPVVRNILGAGGGTFAVELGDGRYATYDLVHDEIWVLERPTMLFEQMVSWLQPFTGDDEERAMVEFAIERALGRFRSL